MVSDLGTWVSVIPESTVRSRLVGVIIWCQSGPQTHLTSRTAGGSSLISGLRSGGAVAPGVAACWLSARFMPSGPKFGGRH